jgi:hypothetical protein
MFSYIKIIFFLNPKKVQYNKSIIYKKKNLKIPASGL